VKKWLDYLSGTVERAPKWIILAVIILSLAMVPGVISLKTDSSLSPLIDPDSTVNRDTQRFQAEFGDEPITLVLNGKVADIFSTANLAVLNDFEQEFPIQNKCYIISPLTVLNQALQQAALVQQNLPIQMAQAQQAAAQAAKQQAEAAGLSPAEQAQAVEQAQNQVKQQFQTTIDQMSQMGIPSLDNPKFVAAVLYNQDGSLNPSLASLIPDQSHVLVIITPENPADSLAISHAIQDYFKVHSLPNVSPTTAGFTLVTEAISSSMKNNLMILLGLAVLVMLLVLFGLFRVRWRLLSLIMVGIGALWTFGLMGYISIPITMATMAVLPVLIGLGIDYPIQFHNRYQEEITRSKSVPQAVVNSFIKMAPAVGIALIATAVGFATLYISKVPMIRDFGIILVIGVVLCYLIALFLLYSIVFQADRRIAVARLGQASQGAGNRIERWLSKLAGVTLKYPLAICLIAIVLAAGGGIVDHWLPVNTDFQKLIPQNMTALQDTKNLNQLLGIGGQVKFMVEADNVTSQAVLSQLKSFEENEIALHPELIAAASPAVLVSSSAGGLIPAQAQIDQILAGSPAPFLKQYISKDKRMAVLSFGIQDISLDQTHNLILAIEQDGQTLNGLRVSSVGTMALSTATIGSVISSRFLMDGLCLLAILIILLLLYRRLFQSLFIIICIGIVIGWSSLTMYLFGIPLNPLTAVLGVMTTAIGTEFMVLLTSRYEEEKASGEAPRQAMLTAVSRMGRAIVTTGVTTLGGFGVLIASNFVIIRDFGIATVIGILLCLISSIIVMPPLLVWWDERRAAKKATRAKSGA
jgi:uncharacterized protein